MIGRRIEGVPDRLTGRPNRRVDAIPAPDCWVVSATYPDQVVWDYYPDSGASVQTVSEYVLGSDDHAYPPRDERERTAVLKRLWPGERLPWRDEPVFILLVDGEVVTSLNTQPRSDAQLTAWWDVVVEVLEAAGTVDGSSLESVASHHPFVVQTSVRKTSRE